MLAAGRKLLSVCMIYDIYDIIYDIISLHFSCIEFGIRNRSMIATDFTVPNSYQLIQLSDVIVSNEFSVVQ